MDKRKVFSLSTDNVITEAVLKLDILFVYFLASEYSQSNIYRDNITSLKHIMKNNTGDNDGLISDVNRQLPEYLLRYFDTADVFVEIVDKVLNISIRVIDSDGVEATLENAMGIKDGRIDTYLAVESLLKR